MDRGVDKAWDDTDFFFGEDSEGNVGGDGGEGSFRRTLGRDYLRVSKDGLKEVLYGEDGSRKFDVIRENVSAAATTPNVFSPPGVLELRPDDTVLTTSDSGRKIAAKIVVDATGAETRFTVRDGREKEGYQIAYGVEARVEGPGVTEEFVGDYNRNKMTLFDYRSEKWRDADGLNSARVKREPTFNYVMPLSKDVIFFEETSLVANPAVSFRDCKRRLAARFPWARRLAWCPPPRGFSCASASRPTCRSRTRSWWSSRQTGRRRSTRTRRRRASSTGNGRRTPSDSTICRSSAGTSS